MIQLYLANHLEDLLEQLIQNIEKEQKQLRNPYEPINIIVPNPNIKYWLKQKIAEHQNICINYNFFYFEEGIQKIINILYKNLKIQENDALNLEEQKIDPDFLSLIIYEILQKKEKELKYFSSFLKEHKNYPGNIYSLSSKLAELYFKYYFHNQELINNLKSEHLTHEIEDELNQYNEVIKDIFFDEQLIYKEIHKKIKTINTQNETQFVLFFEYFHEILKTFHQFKDQLEPIPIFIFAFQFNNVFYFKLLHELKHILNIYYYQCILYDYHNPKYIKKSQEISYTNVELFKEIVNINEKDIVYIPSKTKTSSSLSQFQKQFIEGNLNEPIIDNLKEHEPSIKLIKATDKRSEIKAIIQDIQEQLSRNPYLKLNEIAILSPVLKEYFPLLKGFLDYLKIPYNIQDPSIIEISYLPDAIKTVCQILDELQNQKILFKRTQILKVLENPLFQSTHKFTSSDVIIITKIIDSLNIYYESNNDYYHSWYVALKRIRSSKISDEILTLNQNNGDLYISPFENIEMSQEILEKMHQSIISFMDDILQINEFFRDDTINLETKYKHFEEIIIKHFNVFQYPDPYNIEKRAYNEFQKVLSLLKYFHIPPEGNFLLMYFSLSFEKLKGKINEYLFHGINISSLFPLRPIPFKRIYIVGLNQEYFPGKEIHQNYNLILLFLKDKRYKNNILTIQDQNLFLFYEILLSTREALVLSYRNMSLEEKKELYPAFIYTEIEQYIQKHISSVENYILEIPLTIKLKENKIFNHTFEVYNTLLATYRENLEPLRNIDKLKNIAYLKDIMNCEEPTIKDIYKKYKFPEEEIAFIQLSDRTININHFLNFLQEPVKYYFKKAIEQKNNN